MTSYFGSKYEEQVQQSKEVVDQFNQLLRDIKDTREHFQSETSKQPTATGKKGKPSVAPGKGDDLASHKEPKSIMTPEARVDITEALKGYKLRSEIERAFFFHLFYEILRTQFGMSISGEEKDIFDRKADTVNVQACLNSADIRAVVEGRARWEAATDKERDQWIKQRQERIVYKAQEYPGQQFYQYQQPSHNPKQAQPNYGGAQQKKVTIQAESASKRRGRTTSRDPPI